MLFTFLAYCIFGMPLYLVDNFSHVMYQQYLVFQMPRLKRKERKRQKKIPVHAHLRHIAPLLCFIISPFIDLTFSKTFKFSPWSAKGILILLQMARCILSFIYKCVKNSPSQLRANSSEPRSGLSQKIFSNWHCGKCFKLNMIIT